MLWWYLLVVLMSLNQTSFTFQGSDADSRALEQGRQKYSMSICHNAAMPAMAYMGNINGMQRATVESSENQPGGLSKANSCCAVQWPGRMRCFCVYAMCFPIYFVEDCVAVWYLSVSLSGRSEAERCASQPLSTAFTSPRCLVPTCHFRIPKDHAKTRSSCSGYGVETREVCILRPLSCCTVLVMPCTTVTLKNVVSPFRLCSL